MEKDKLSILDVWGAYGQKDIEILDRSEINKPAHESWMTWWRPSELKRFRANYTDIFDHRSMEKDKLFVLDVCGAYGQKDIEILYRSELARLSGVGWV